MKHATLGFARYRTPMLAVMVTLGTLMFTQPSHAAACVNGVYRAGCAGPNGAVGVRKPYPHRYGYGYHRPVVAPTVPTERAASDPMGLGSSAGHISGNNSGAAASKEPQLEGLGGGADLGFSRCGDQPERDPAALDTGAVDDHRLGVGKSAP